MTQPIDFAAARAAVGLAPVRTAAERLYRGQPVRITSGDHHGQVGTVSLIQAHQVWVHIGCTPHAVKAVQLAPVMSGRSRG